MDYHHLEMKYFLNTMARGSYLINVCPNIHMIEQKAVNESDVNLSDFLFNRRVVFFYRHTEWNYRWRSQCIVRTVLQRHRSAAGQVETIVGLEREDGSYCTIGIHLGDYWSLTREMTEKALLWYIVRSS